MRLLDQLRDRVTVSATGMFKHARYPLADTLSHPGDPGRFGPGSVSWQVIGDTSVFVGGIRALLVQAAHPEVAAGVSQHSRYREDPLGRLSRTSNHVTAATFGVMPEVEADRFVAEQTRVGALLGADPMPETAAGLASWVSGNAAVGGSPGLVEAIEFLRRPPLRRTIRPGYRVLFQAAVATIPPGLRRTLGLRRHPGAIVAGRLLVRFLRWSLGSSPTWNLALVRVGAPVPGGVFRQPLPTETLDAWGSGP
jgi:uncharacterized protein (DUF2236 family)